MDREVLAVLPTGYGKVSFSKLLRDGDLFQRISVQWSHAHHAPLATLKLCSCSLSCDQRNRPILKQQPHRRQMSFTKGRRGFLLRPVFFFGVTFIEKLFPGNLTLQRLAAVIELSTLLSNTLHTQKNFLE